MPGEIPVMDALSKLLYLSLCFLVKFKKIVNLIYNYRTKNEQIVLLFNRAVDLLAEVERSSGRTVRLSASL
jgi:hypothetical protein